MSMSEKPKSSELVYSKHRYLDLEGGGKPDYEKIFSKGDEKFWINRHIDTWLLEHFDNQDLIITGDKFILKHLTKCDECWIVLDKARRKKLKEDGQMDLPLDSNEQNKDPNLK